MNSIGFDNFRRFANFPEMDLGDITLLVGRNNSGKSTLVKALLLCIDNARLMKSMENRALFARPVFRFDANEWHDVKIKTFSRAIHNKPTKSFDPLEEGMSLPTEMRFRFTLGHFKFSVQVAGNRDKNEVTGDVTAVSIEDRENMIKFEIDYKTNRMYYYILGQTSERETLIKRLYHDYISAKESLDSLLDVGDNIAAISAQSEKVSSLEKRIEEFVNPDGNDLPDDFDYAQALKEQFKSYLSTQYTSDFYDLPIEDYLNISSENLLVHVIGNFIDFANNPGKAAPKIKDPVEGGIAMQAWMHVEEARAALKQEVDKMRKSKEDLSILLDHINVEYITVHAANQNTIYNTADKNDYIAQTVHEYMRAKITPGSSAYNFVTEWMKTFDIGSSFKIVPIDGEAYRVQIKDADGSTVNLADKGMGSIQVMILLIRLATIVWKYRLDSKIPDLVHDIYMPTIIIEEPEQNLHPEAQCKLADLIHYMNKQYGCRFIIETHSEYLIRRTQVIVAGDKYDDKDLKEFCPFVVYYFDSNNEKKPYYQMEYRTDGKFANEFGTGFFDTASNLAFELF